MAGTKYVLITAAHNEQDYIEKTIISVVNQAHKPAEWIIVNDGSTDSTESIIRRYENENPFIKVINSKRNGEHNFASKVYALKIGLQNISTKEFDYIGILDADVSFEKDYYSSLIEEFKKNPKLGIAGGFYFDIVNGKKVPVKSSPYSIRGATQFFHRECFEKIGGLKSVKYGGEDALACYTARMYGWEIKNFDNLIVLHHKPTGLSAGNIFKARFRDGFVEYNLGYHPLFQFIKCMKRIFSRPLFIGSLIRFAGFWLAYLKREERAVPKEVMNFIRKDQLARIFNLQY